MTEAAPAVEGVTARRVDSFRECQEIWSAGEIPLMVDPQGEVAQGIQTCSSDRWYPCKTESGNGQIHG